jgi:hypothetical protein
MPFFMQQRMVDAIPCCGSRTLQDCLLGMVYVEKDEVVRESSNGDSICHTAGKCLMFGAPSNFVEVES